MDKGRSTSTPVLPVTASEQQAGRSRLHRKNVWKLSLATIVLIALSQWTFIRSQAGSRASVRVPIHAEEILDKCRMLDAKPGPPEDFNLRGYSDRFVPGTKATLIKVRCSLSLSRAYDLIYAC